MAKFLKWLLLEVVLFAVLFTGMVAVTTLYINPYMKAASRMPKDGSLQIRQLKSGDLEISWPEADRAHYYIFQMYQLPNDGQLSYQNDAASLALERKITDGTKIVLPVGKFSGNMLFRVTSAVSYVRDGTWHDRLGDYSLEAITRIDPPQIKEYTYNTDSEKQTATIKMDLLHATTCVISVRDQSGKWQHLKDVDGDAITLTFAQDGDIPMLDFGQRIQFRIEVYRKGDGVKFLGTDCVEFFVDRTMLVPSDLKLISAVTSEGCLLYWDTEECDYYEIQFLDTQTQTWVLHSKVDKHSDNFVITDVPEGTFVVARVVAAYEKEVKGQEEVVVKYRAISNEIGFVAENWQILTPEE